nr:VIER F-box protein 2 [Tanacetum cinerariifolium]
MDFFRIRCIDLLFMDAIVKLGHEYAVSSLMDMAYRLSEEEFEKLKSLKINDDSLTCNTSLEIFHNEFNRMSRMDDDLFTYEVENPGLANIPCDLNKDDDLKQWMTHGSDDDMVYDPSNVEFIEWLASKFYNHKTMGHYTKNALCFYWVRGDDEVELTDEESSCSDDEDEVVKIFRVDTNVFDFETPTCRAFKEFNCLLQIDPDVHTKDIKGFKTYEDYKDDWIYEWIKDVPWVHEKPWTNDARKWDDYENTNRDYEKEYEMEHEDEERCELSDDTTHERPVCNIRRFEMIKYSFGEDKEHVAVKENEYDDLMSIKKNSNLKT